jgi:hypothetical protein
MKRVKWDLTAAQIEAARAMPVLRVRVAEQVYPLNRNKLYRMMRSGELPFAMIHGHPYPTVAGLEALCTPKVEAA